MANLFYTPGTIAKNTLARAEAITTEITGIEAGFDKVPPQLELEQNRVAYAADTGAANAYVVALPHTLAAYTAGLSIRVKITNANTGASTINVDSLGVKTITRFSGDPLQSGDLPAGGVVTLTYDGTNFQTPGNQTGVVVDISTSPLVATGSLTSRTTGARAADIYNVLDHDLVNTTGTDNKAFFNTLVALVVSGGVPAIIKFPYGWYDFDGPLDAIDMSYVSILLENAVLDFSGAGASGTAMPLKGSVSANNRIASHFIRGGHIKGSGEAGGLDCFVCDGTSPGVNRMRFSDLLITEFQDGFTAGDNTFLIEFDHCVFDHNQRHLYFPSLTNGGENTQIRGGTMGRCLGHAIDKENSGDMYATGTSFDTNAGIVRSIDGRLTLRDCHLEQLAANPWSAALGKAPVLIPTGADGKTQIIIEGGLITAPTAIATEHMFFNDVPSDAAFIEVVGMEIPTNVAPTSDRLAGGRGRTSVRRRLTNDLLVNKRLTGRIDNALNDGAFIGGAIADYMSVVRNVGLASTTTRLDTSDLTLTASATARHDWTFDASDKGVAGDVDLATDEITLTAHNTYTGQQWVYNSDGGTDIGGLTTGTTYYEIFVDANTIKLATSEANAWAGTGIDLTTQPASETHQLRSGTVGLLCNVKDVDADFVFAVPIQGGVDSGLCEFWAKKAAGAVDVNWKAMYMILVNDGDGVVVDLLKQGDTLNNSITISSTTWAFKQMDKLVRSPSWATHFGVFFELGADTPNDVYLDDFVINIQ